MVKPILNGRAAAGSCGKGPFLAVLLIVIILVIIHSNDKAFTTPNSSANTQKDSDVVAFPTAISEEDPWKRQLLQRLNVIRRVCGELCAVNDMETFQKKTIDDLDSKYKVRLEANVDCDAILGSVEIDAGDTTVPHPPPEELMHYYTLNGSIPFMLGQRFQNVYLGGETNAGKNVWTKELIDKNMQLIGQGNFRGTYREKITMAVVSHLEKMNLKGKSVLVVGSETPWVESAALYHGAAKVTTLEYGKIYSEHPQIVTLTPPEFRKAYQSQTLEFFDAVLSFSSLEHPGLGRYGDALNPWSDLLAVARVWCVTKPNGLLYLGVPSGGDLVKFNANRVYGKIRWPLLTTNWKQIRSIEEKNFGSAGMGLIFEKILPGEERSS